ncbi:hypothetical protein C8T65DRAFT_645618 [Cerioporus squamosus]|nr:hypothetical protein C8T65DRAFT_645618 [Cerioporus squamosus]
MLVAGADSSSSRQASTCCPHHRTVFLRGRKPASAPRNLLEHYSRDDTDRDELVASLLDLRPTRPCMPLAIPMSASRESQGVSHPALISANANNQLCVHYDDDLPVDDVRIQGVV